MSALLSPILQAEAEAAAATLQKSLSAATAGKDSKAAAALEKQLEPLQQRIAALKAAGSNESSADAGNVSQLLQELQASLKTMAGELSALAASSSGNAELAALLKSLTGVLLVQLCDGRSWRVVGSRHRSHAAAAFKPWVVTEWMRVPAAACLCPRLLHGAAELASLSAAAKALSDALPSVGVEDAAIAAGQGAGWFVLAMLGVGAMQAVKAGADVALNDVSFRSALGFSFSLFFTRGDCTLTSCATTDVPALCLRT